MRIVHGFLFSSGCTPVFIIVYLVSISKRMFSLVHVRAARCRMSSISILGRVHGTSDAKAPRRPAGKAPV